MPGLLAPFTMDLTNQKVIVGGWRAFAEATGVNKKEPVENFDWIPSESDKFYYNDLRAALDAVEGSREWLKDYVYDKNKEPYPYSCEIGEKVSKAMSGGHSGASGSAILSCYRSALKDWDTFVFKTKEHVGLKAYKEQQIPLWKVRSLLDKCHIWISTEDEEMRVFLQNMLFTECAKLCLTGMHVPEIRATLCYIEKDLTIIQLEDDKKKAEQDHQDLMGSIEFLYEHPIRWFDTPQGCSLRPGHPKNITKRAIAEMEAKFPGYNQHIENVLVAMGSPRKPMASSWDDEGRAAWNGFLKSQKVLA